MFDLAPPSEKSTERPCMVMCYAPTNDAENDSKDEFYNRLRSVLNERSEREIVVLLGDFNAKIGSDNSGYERIMGCHGKEGEMNENGELFADLCAENDLVIGGSIFPHKEIHKITWVSPDKQTFNQIDHICICSKFRRSLLDVKSRRGADAFSDHYLVSGKLQLKLKRCPQVARPVKYDVQKLKDEGKRVDFTIKLSNKFQALQNVLVEDESIEGSWEAVKGALITSCEECMGQRRRQNKPWISEKTLEKIDERREMYEKVLNAKTRSAKHKTQQDYKQKHQEVRKSVKQDKRNHIEELATKAETAAEQRNLKDLYTITRLLSGKTSSPEKPIKDKNGTILNTPDQQKRRWAEHFHELLNRPAPETRANIIPAESQLPINCQVPTVTEIKAAIKSLKNGKSAGPDGIPAEALKADIDTTAKMLHPLFKQIWSKEDVPKDWKTGHIIKLLKKGDLGECKNYRGIMLLSVPGKVLSKILLDRMKGVVDKELREQQAGFRRERSCTDQIAALRMIIEQSVEWNSPLYINFIDFEKAFDSLDRETLWMLMRHYGIPEKFISVIKHMYEGMTCQVLHGGDKSEEFTVQTGVRQGCLLSPFLFLLVIDWLMKETTEGKRNGIQWDLYQQLDDLDFADDIALLAHKHEQMQNKTTLLEENAAKTGLRINHEKTKTMRVNARNSNSITLSRGNIEDVTTFTYLGSKVNEYGGTEEDVKTRISKARVAFSMLKKVWRAKEISLKTKMRIFNSNVKSVLLYGSETWSLTVANEARIQSFVNRCLRYILRVWWPNRIRNEELWEKTKQLPIGIQIKQRKWKWIGHTLRKDNANITRAALRWTPQGKRKEGDLDLPGEEWWRRRWLKGDTVGEPYNNTQATGLDLEGSSAAYVPPRNNKA